MIASRTALAFLLASPSLLAQGEDAEKLMTQLETRLLSARHVAIEASIEAQGAVAAKLQGRSEWRDRNRASLTYSGTFMGQPAELALVTDSHALSLTRGATNRREATPREANRAMLIGMLRMGQLHTLAKLHGLELPDQSEGGVEQWVVLDNFRPTTFAQGGDLEGAMSFGFDMVVAGRDSGSARLWLDTSTGLPRRRLVTVRFPQGEMTVVEDYTKFVVE